MPSRLVTDYKTKDNLETFFNKITGPRPVTLLKKRLRHRCFPVNFGKFLRTTFPTEHVQWLLLQSHDNILSKGDLNLEVFK